MGEAPQPMDLRSLVDQHYGVLYRYAYHLSGSAADAEDLTQETFCTAQAKHGQLRNPASARGWLCKILRNHYLHGLRTVTATPVASLDELPHGAEAVEESDGGLTAEQLRQAISEMPEAYRTPIILFYFEEFSYRQIADQMGIPMGTVMSRLARGKAYLRSRLRPEYVTARVVPSSPGVT